MGLLSLRDRLNGEWKVESGVENYGEWRITVYDVIFGELRFLDSHTT